MAAAAEVYVSAIESSLLGAALGSIAETTTAIWPVAIVLALNLLAVVSAVRAPAIRD